MEHGRELVYSGVIVTAEGGTLGDSTEQVFREATLTRQVSGYGPEAPDVAE